MYNNRPNTNEIHLRDVDLGLKLDFKVACKVRGTNMKARLQSIIVEEVSAYLRYHNGNTDKPPSDPNLIKAYNGDASLPIRNVPEKLKEQFKWSCRCRGTTMRAVLITRMVRDVVECRQRQKLREAVGHAV